MENPFVVLLQITRAFNDLGIDYVVVGSIASSIHGDYRASADIDIVADIRLEQVDPLVNKLKTDFYVDDLAVANAIARRGSFNAIHLTAIFKIDVFIPSHALGRQQLLRRELHTIATELPQQVWVATAEDTILAKLEWYRRGQEISELQWRDVKGILGTQRSRLDREYLHSWAERIGILDLLARAEAEIGLPLIGTEE